MPKLVVHGAQLKCNHGTAAASLAVPKSIATGDDNKAATILDHRPTVNVPPFGMCQTLANPQVASATSAAQGVLTPVPCLPVVSAPWTPGASVVTVDDVPALTSGCTCACSWSGVIEVVDPGSPVDVD